MKNLLLLSLLGMVIATSCGPKGPKEGGYTDFSLPSIDGKELKLSTTVDDNRYTLLDFWASWCGPCMGELPYLKTAYEAYHGRGFEIFAVSYDDNAESWKGAIEANGMNWIHVSSLNGWDCPTQPMYGVYSIPRNLLIDEDGMIVAENLRGEELIAKLAELLPAK